MAEAYRKARSDSVNPVKTRSIVYYISPYRGRVQADGMSLGYVGSIDAGYDLHHAPWSISVNHKLNHVQR